MASTKTCVASQVLEELRESHDEGVLDLQDAVTVYRDDSGQLRLDQSYEPTTRAAGWGALVGALLAIPFAGPAGGAAAVGALLTGVLAGGAIGAVGGAADAAFWKSEFGIPEDFVANLASSIKSGDSAIVALLRSDDVRAELDRLAGYGGRVVRTTLTSEQEDRLRKRNERAGPSAST